MGISSRVSCGAGLVTLAVLVLIDVVAGTSIVPFGFFGLPPLMASMASTPRVTAAMSVAATATAGALAVGFRDLPGSSYASLVLVALFGVLAVVISRAQLKREASLHHAQRVAVIAQRAVIRALPSAVGPVLLASRYVSATKEAQIGGDLYEVSVYPNGLRVIVGDVRGKGLAAVHLAADVLSTFRAWAPLEDDAAALLKRLDLAVTETAEDEEYVTAMIVDVATDGLLTVTNSGHHPPLLISLDGTADRYELLGSATATPPLGLFDLGPDTPPTPHEFRWKTGDRLLMYTDGLVEAPGPAGHDYPPDAWAPLLSGGDLETCLDRLVEGVNTHTRNRLDDDLALVLLQHQERAAS